MQNGAVEAHDPGRVGVRGRDRLEIPDGAGQLRLPFGAAVRRAEASAALARRPSDLVADCRM